MDGFKVINTAYGYVYGNKLLVKVAEFLNMLRPPEAQSTKIGPMSLFSNKILLLSKNFVT